MPAMIIKHKVADFATWLAAYEAHADIRKASGAIKSMVWRDAEDPNNVVLLIKFEDLSRAHEFTASENLKQVMKEAGVIEQPTIYYLEDGRKFDN